MVVVVVGAGVGVVGVYKSVSNVMGPAMTVDFDQIHWASARGPIDA